MQLQVCGRELLSKRMLVWNLLVIQETLVIFGIVIRHVVLRCLVLLVLQIIMDDIGREKTKDLFVYMIQGIQYI